MHRALHDSASRVAAQASTEDARQIVDRKMRYARLSVAFQAVLTVEIGWSGRCGLGKTKGLLGACALFHACKTSHAYADKGIGSAEPGVFTLLSKRMSLSSKFIWSQRSENPSL